MRLHAVASGESAVRSDAEDGIAVTRWLLAMISTALYLGTASVGEGVSPAVAGAISAGLLLLPAFIAGVRWMLVKWALPPIAAAAILQLVDTLGLLVVAVVATGVSPDTAWALLTVPIVVSALRFGALGVLTTWAAVSASLPLVSQLGLVEVSAPTVVFERSGTLLAVAAVVALLTSWLQAGWESQAQLTAEGERRVGYLRAVEEAIAAMHQIPTEDMLVVVLDHGSRLDFQAVTAWHPREALMAVGDGAIVPSDLTFDVEPEVIEVTQWTAESGGSVTSVSVNEARTGRVITGWTTEATSRAQVEAFGELVTQASSRIELAEMLKAARMEARIDPLTGLWRRHVLDQRLEQLARQPGEIALLFVDLDYFKQINDAYGHHVGDETLASAGQRLRRLVGKYGFVARYGGDEFVVLLAGPVARFADDLAARAAAAIAAPLTIDGKRIPLGATIGVAVGRGPMSPAVLLHQADEAVLAAKAKRNAEVGHDGRQLVPR